MCIQKYRPYLAPSEIRSGLCSLGKAMTSQGSPSCTATLLWSSLYTEMIWTKHEINLKDIHLMSSCGVKLYTLEMRNKSVKMCWFSWNGVISRNSRSNLVLFCAVEKLLIFIHVLNIFKQRNTLKKKIWQGKFPWWWMWELTWYRGAISSLWFFFFPALISGDLSAFCSYWSSHCRADNQFAYPT